MRAAALWASKGAVLAVFPVDSCRQRDVPRFRCGGIFSITFGNDQVKEKLSK
jgi:hypothetical protein